jgi:hypothetical protein
MYGGRLVPRWSVPVAAAIVRDVLVPAGGLFGMLTDRPLTALTGGAYIAMMGIPAAGYLDRQRKEPAKEPPP